MQSKASAVLIAGMILLMIIIPVSAYDYQGVPRPGESNYQDTSSIATSTASTTSDSLSGLNLGDLSSILESPDVATLISLILSFIFQLLGIST